MIIDNKRESYKAHSFILCTPQKPVLGIGSFIG